MTQNIEKIVFKEFTQKLEEPDFKRKAGASTITDSGQPPTSWMREVTARIRISDIAKENGIDMCPKCDKYVVNFDDGRGWFCCQGHPECNFSGNIVDFVSFLGVEL